VIPPAFDYERATSLDDALERMQKCNGVGKVIAGGHSLIPLMKLRFSEPTLLIDIARVPELGGIREKNGRVVVGATTVHHDIATSPVVREQCAVLADAAAEIGDQQVRNRGTIGGSLAHADPSADYPAVMLALDAEVHLKGPNGWRAVKATDFFQDLLTVDMQLDEILVNVQFAPAPLGAYAKLHQKASHYAIVGVAVTLDMDGDSVRSARVGLTGACPSAIRLRSVEEALAGRPLNADTIALAASKADGDLTTINSDMHASEAYRRAMVPVFTRRALDAARARA
jgi:aerobic carbon-monoxide dehydrogenase medium subunit